MEFALKSSNGLFLAGMLTTTGAAMAQVPTIKPASGTSDAANHASPDNRHHLMGHRDPAKMQT